MADQVCKWCQKPIYTSVMYATPSYLHVSQEDYDLCGNFAEPVDPPAQRVDRSTPPPSASPTARLCAALEALVAKLEIILPLVDDAIILETIHGRPYTGPTIAEELGAARLALAAAKEDDNGC